MTIARDRIISCITADRFEALNASYRNLEEAESTWVAAEAFWRVNLPKNRFGVVPRVAANNLHRVEEEVLAAHQALIAIIGDGN